MPAPARLTSMSQSPEETQDQPQPPTDGGRTPGYRVVLAVGGVAFTIAAVIIAFAVLVDIPSHPDAPCGEAPQACTPPRA